MPSKIDDLTIFLRATDKTKKAFDSASKRMEKMNKLGRAITKTFTRVGGAMVAGFTAAAVNGKLIVAELNLMSSALGISQREADALFETVREAAPTAEIDKVKEAVLTLQEGFFDARAESGPLFDLIKDFGADIDLSLTEPKAQLTEFLRVLKQLPDDTIRAGAVISNLGADDAKPFLEFANNADKLDQAIIRLTGSIENIPGVISQAELDNMNEAKEAAGRLSVAWDRFSEVAYSLVAPALAVINDHLASFLTWVTNGVRKLGEFFGIFDKFATTPAESISGIDEQIVSMTDSLNEAEMKLASLKASADANPLAGFGGGVNRAQEDVDSIIDSLDKLLKARDALEKQEAEQRKISKSAKASNISGSGNKSEGIVIVINDDNKVLSELERVQKTGLTIFHALENPLDAFGGSGIEIAATIDKEAFCDSAEEAGDSAGYKAAERFNRQLQAITDINSAIGIISQSLDDASADAYANEISRIDSQRDMLDTKTQELNEARIRNQVMMQQMGVQALRQNPFDAELEKIKRQQKELDVATDKAYQKRKKDFERNKKIQKAVAIVENIAAGVKAYNSAGGGYTGLAALAFSLATGYAQVQKICATQFDGGGGVGGSPGGAGGAGGAGQAQGGNLNTSQALDLPQGQQGNVTINIEGSVDKSFSAEDVQELITQINDLGLGRRLEVNTA